jgi:hypothetical protein
MRYIILRTIWWTDTAHSSIITVLDQNDLDTCLCIVRVTPVETKQL